MNVYYHFAGKNRQNRLLHEFLIIKKQPSLDQFTNGLIAIQSFGHCQFVTNLKYYCVCLVEKWRQQDKGLCKGLLAPEMKIVGGATY